MPFTSIPSSIAIVVNDLREREEFRADFQIRPVGRFRINRKTDVIFFQEKFDSAAGGGESACVADQKRTLAAEGGDHVAVVELFGSADKRDLAARPGWQLERSKALNQCRPAVDRFVRNIFIEEGPKGIASYDADRKGRLCTGKRRRRPIDEFCEIEEESRFQLVLGGLI